MLKPMVNLTEGGQQPTTIIIIIVIINIITLSLSLSLLSLPALFLLKTRSWLNSAWNELYPKLKLYNASKAGITATASVFSIGQSFLRYLSQ